jgi:hypothetical protein
MSISNVQAEQFELIVTASVGASKPGLASRFAARTAEQVPMPATAAKPSAAPRRTRTIRISSSSTPQGNAKTSNTDVTAFILPAASSFCQGNYWGFGLIIIAIYRTRTGGLSGQATRIVLSFAAFTVFSTLYPTGAG